MNRFAWLRAIGLTIVLGAACGTGPAPEHGPLRCFVAGTRVATPDGRRAIEHLRAGDAVWSWATDTTAPVVGRITHVHRSTATELIRVTAGELQIAGVTPRHPFYDPRRDVYVPAEQLRAGDRVLAWLGTGEPRHIEVTAIERFAPPAPVAVYNVSVGEIPNYFAEGILVHNKQPVRVDMDGDGAWAREDGSYESSGDCDDSDPTIYPGAPEVCGEGVDRNCDGSADSGCVTADGEPLSITVDDDNRARLEPYGLDLGEYHELAVAAYIDLRGPDVVVHQLASETPLPPLPADSAEPAVLFTIGGPGGAFDFVLVRIAGGDASIVWRHPVVSDTWRFVRLRVLHRDGRPAALHLVVQQGDDFETLRFEYGDDGYQPE